MGEVEKGFEADLRTELSLCLKTGVLEMLRMTIGVCLLMTAAGRRAAADWKRTRETIFACFEEGLCEGGECRSWYQM
jgi:hypothetical protein